MKNTICLSLMTLLLLWKYVHLENTQYFIAFFPFARKDLRNHSASSFLWFSLLPHPPPRQKQLLLPWQHYRINLLLLDHLYPTWAVLKLFVSFSCLSSTKSQASYLDADLPEQFLWGLTELLRCSRRPISKFEGLIHSFGFGSFP